MTTPVSDSAAERDVLVVDDHASIRTLLSTALARKGLPTHTASDGAEAISLLGRHHYRVLALDLMMPQVNGWDVLDWLLENPDSKPDSVIILTATDRDVMNRLDPSVVNAIIFKPFDVLEVAAYIEACCDPQIAADRRSKRLVGNPRV